jgi:hypothetical protein
MITSFIAWCVFAVPQIANASTWYSHAGSFRYAFEVENSTSNIWNPTTEAQPRLPPSKALSIAQEFMRDVPCRFDSIWVAKTISLERVDNQPDQWTYVVAFWPGPKPGLKGWGGSFAPFNVIVTFEGKAARLKKEKSESPKRPEPPANPTFKRNAQ